MTKIVNEWLTKSFDKIFYRHIVKSIFSFTFKKCTIITFDEPFKNKHNSNFFNKSI